MLCAIWRLAVDRVSGVPSPHAPAPTIKEEWDRLIDRLAGVPPRDQRQPASGVEPEAAEHAVPAVDQPATPLETYLEYYRGLRHPGPGYAVLATGPFGTGKTHQVLQALPEEKRIYVSLFGVRSVEQLHAEVVAAASPSLEKIAKTAKIAGDAAKSLGGLFAFGAAASPVINAMLRRDVEPNRVLIFDDLERCSLEPTDLFGSINQYVEHRGFRVVVIANEDAIVEKDPNAKKEKLFGKTIRIEPQTDQAFDSFLRESDGRARSFVEAHKNTVLDIFHESGEQSLRILRHVMEDLGRLALTLSDGHISNNKAMAAVVAHFTAFDIEVRNDCLRPEDLKGRRNTIDMASIVGHSKPDEEWSPPPIYVADKKYATVDLGSDLLSDDVLTSLFVHGRYDPDAIQACLDQSRFFIRPAEADPWLVVRNFDAMDDAVLAEAVRRMEQQFEGREVTESGDMLHIFMLRLMMVENGMLPGSIEDQVEACKAYIDDLLAERRLPPRETGPLWRQVFDVSYGGYGYWGGSTTDTTLPLLLRYLVNARERAFELTLPAVGDDLLELMKTDPERFRDLLSPTRDGAGDYTSVPVLHKIDPERFVDAWLAAPRKHWQTIKHTLGGRFSQGHVTSKDLAIEKDWARQVGQLLLDRAAAATGFQAIRIKWAIPGQLEAYAEADETALADANAAADTQRGNDG